MRRAYRGRGRRTTFGGIWKWTLLILVPCAVLFVETWLNTQTFQNDYEMAQINQRINALQLALDTFEVQQARLEALDRIDVAVQETDLVEPEPGQIQVIYYAESDEAPADGAVSYVMASRPTGATVREPR